MIFRAATEADLPAIVALLADDPLGAAREGADLAPYRAAFARIAAAPDTQLIVAEEDGRLIGTYQLSLLPGLAAKGQTRAQVESVRVLPQMRSRGIGAAMMADAEARARALGAGLIQLTTHNSRTRAHAFYERVGFTQSHKGYKRVL